MEVAGAVGVEAAGVVVAGVVVAEVVVAGVVVAGEVDEGGVVADDGAVGEGVAGAGVGAGAAAVAGAAGGGDLVDCTSAGLRPWMLRWPEALALTMAISPGLTSRRAPPSVVATSTAPSTTWTEAPDGSTVTLKVVPFTTAAR